MVRVRKVLQKPSSLPPLPPNISSDALASCSEIENKCSLDLDNCDSRIKIEAISAFPFKGGEMSALDRIQNYIWESDKVTTYKQTRNGLIGTDYSTKFSPWLAIGCLSPRLIYAEIKQYEKMNTANESTYWVTFELLWRDFFHFVGWKYGDNLFRETGIRGINKSWSKDMNLFEKWKKGITGVPFIDANMRELLHTGWMSNRGRQNVASFLVKDLKLDWRLGAEWFESMLIDHDACSNYGNWNYAAGIGNDPREDRKFNIIKQSLDYDLNGDFISTWVPELAKLSDKSCQNKVCIHYPWKLKQHELQNIGICLGDTYPKPIIVKKEWEKYYKTNINNEKPLSKNSI